MQKEFDKELSRILPKGKVLLAVSGGIDSMCMAHLFLHSEVLAEKGGFEVAHCNFGLRGEESDADEELVKNWCRENGIPFHSERFDTEKYASDNGISIEMAARELRYGWFASLSESDGFCAVAVAHNANDNAETLILNLTRGTGLKGITGMGFKAVKCATDTSSSRNFKERDHQLCREMEHPLQGRQDQCPRRIQA